MAQGNVKYRDIKKILKEAIGLFGGHIKNHNGGSGVNYQIGNQHGGFHKPHGRDGNQFDKGALKNVINDIQSASSTTK